MDESVGYTNVVRQLKKHDTTDRNLKTKRMKKILFTIYTGIALSLTSCGQVDPNKNIDEGKVEGNVYTSEENSLTIEILKGWTVIDNEKTKKTNEKRIRSIEATMEGEINYSRLRNRISLQKDQFTIFQ